MSAGVSQFIYKACLAKAARLVYKNYIDKRWFDNFELKQSANKWGLGVVIIDKKTVKSAL